jgi:hypothetical protein
MSPKLVLRKVATVSEYSGNESYTYVSPSAITLMQPTTIAPEGGERDVTWVAVGHSGFFSPLTERQLAKKLNIGLD